MTREAQVYSALSTSSSLLGVVICADVAPDDTLPPYVVFSESSYSPENMTLLGESSLVECRYQIDVYGTDRKLVSSIAESIRIALYESLAAVQVSKVSLYEKDTKLRRTMQEFNVFF